MSGECGREAPGSGPCILAAAPDDKFGHWGGCSWESEDAWQAIPNDVCPACSRTGSLEIRAMMPVGSGSGEPALRTEYRCHACGETGAARPAAT